MTKPENVEIVASFEAPIIYCVSDECTHSYALFSVLVGSDDKIYNIFQQARCFFCPYCGSKQP